MKKNIKVPIILCIIFCCFSSFSFDRLKFSLFASAASGNLSQIDRLLKRGVDINSRNSDGMTPFMYYVKRFKNIDGIKFFLDNGADVNAKDNKQITVLMYALSHFNYTVENYEIVKLLINQGAKVNKVDKNGLSVLDIAKYKRKDENTQFRDNIIKLLIKHGAVEKNKQEINSDTQINTIKNQTNKNNEIFNFINLAVSNMFTNNIVPKKTALKFINKIKSYNEFYPMPNENRMNSLEFNTQLINKGIVDFVLAYYYFIINNISESKKYILNSLDIYKKFILKSSTDIHDITYGYFNWIYALYCHILINSNNNNELKYHINSWEKILKDNDRNVLAHGNYNFFKGLAEVNKEKALKYFLLAINSLDGFMIPYFKKYSLNNVGKIYYSRKMYESAYNYFQMALAYNSDYEPLKVNLILSIKKLNKEKQEMDNIKMFMQKNRDLIMTIFQKIKNKKIPNAKNIAVLPFTCINNIRPIIGFDKILEAMFIGGLTNIKKYNIVERDKLKTMKKEIALSRSKWGDKRFIINVGKIIAANYMLTGTYYFQNNEFFIDYRIFDTSSGVIVHTAKITGNNLGNIRNLIYKSLREVSL